MNNFCILFQYNVKQHTDRVDNGAELEAATGKMWITKGAKLC